MQKKYERLPSWIPAQQEGKIIYIPGNRPARRIEAALKRRKISEKPRLNWEERILRQHLGTSYRNFKRRNKRLEKLGLL